MAVSNSSLLFIIILLFFFSMGVSLSVISHQVMTHRGKHFMHATVNILIIFTRRISRSFLVLFERNKKCLIQLCIYISLMAYLFMVFFHPWYVTYVAKISLAACYQILPITKEFIAKTEPTEDQIKICNLLDMMKYTGLAMGCISGGYILQCTQNFSSNAIYSIYILVVAIMLMRLIDDDPSSEMPESDIYNIPKKCLRRIKNLGHLDYRPFIGFLVIEVLYNLLLLLTYLRFGFLLWYNYKVDRVIMGYIKSYDNFLLYSSTWVISHIVENSLERENLCFKALFSFALCTPALFFAGNLVIFLIVFTFMAFCINLITFLLQQDVFGYKKTLEITEAVDTIVHLTIFIVLPIYGIITDIFGGTTLKLAALAPLFLYVGFLKWLSAVESPQD